MNELIILLQILISLLTQQLLQMEQRIQALEAKQPVIIERIIEIPTVTPTSTPIINKEEVKTEPPQSKGCGFKSCVSA